MPRMILPLPFLTDIKSRTPRTKLPRLDSLLHRLQYAKDGNGRPLDFYNELLKFLDDPPPGTGDRWQKGADLCRRHGIETHRMSVWRLYRAHIIEWRRTRQVPPHPGG